MDSIKIIKGHLIDTVHKDRFRVCSNSYIVIKDSLVEGLYEEIPTPYRGLPVTDYGSSLIIPSFIDLHVHAPQFLQRGIGLDLELIDWLNQYTFTLEEEFQDPEFAREVYPAFVQSLYDQGTLRSCIFGTIHSPGNKVLVESLIKRGLSAYVGKVNMDRNSPEELTEETEKSLSDTKAFIGQFNNNDRVQPIITPRFAPSCSEELLFGLGQMAQKYGIPVQSHLSENEDEVKWVKELFPTALSYSHVYEKYGLLGQTKTLMAHGIYLEADDLERVNHPHVTLVHCPEANLNLTSGIMAVTDYLDRGINVGLGTDVGAGHSLAMNRVIVRAVQSSKARYRLCGDTRILKHAEAFYMATKGNGSFFGKTGSFEKGHSFDALVIQDSLPRSDKLTPLERLYRFLYCGDDRNIAQRYLEGREI